MIVGRPDNLAQMLGGTNNGSSATDAPGFQPTTAPHTSFQSLLDSFAAPRQIRQRDEGTPFTGSGASNPYAASFAMQTSYVSSIGNDTQPRFGGNAPYAAAFETAGPSSTGTDGAGSTATEGRYGAATAQQERTSIDTSSRNGDPRQNQVPGSSADTNTSTAAGSRSRSTHSDQPNTAASDAAAGARNSASGSQHESSSAPEAHGQSANRKTAAKIPDNSVNSAKSAQPPPSSKGVPPAHASTSTEAGHTAAALKSRARETVRSVGSFVGMVPGREGATKANGTEKAASTLIGMRKSEPANAFPEIGARIAVRDLRTKISAKSTAASPNQTTAKGLVNALLVGLNPGSDSGNAKKADSQTTAQSTVHKKAEAAVASSQPNAQNGNVQELTQLRHTLSEQPSQQHQSGDGAASSNSNNQGINGMQFGATSAVSHATSRAQAPIPQAGAYAELARQLKSGMSTDIVREAKVVLRDQNSGEIRMTLRPESLGRVRIQLHVVDNRIGGQIFVDNVNVRDVFQQNLTQLYQAFQTSGFEAGMLEVSVGNGNDSSASQGESGSNPPRNTGRVESTAMPESGAQRFADANYGSGLVNMIV